MVRTEAAREGGRVITHILEYNETMKSTRVNISKRQPQLVWDGEVAFLGGTVQTPTVGVCGSFRIHSSISALPTLMKSG